MDLIGIEPMHIRVVTNFEPFEVSTWLSQPNETNEYFMYGIVLIALPLIKLSTIYRLVGYINGVDVNSLLT